MSSIQFNLQRLHALSLGLESPESWELWRTQNHRWPDSGSLPQCNAIPAMMKRRMSTISKLAVQVASELTQESKVDFVIFASRHGELERSTSLLKEIQRGQPASPTAFSQSVHNTAAGLFTIANSMQVPATSLAACEDTFHCALTEASIFLDEHKNSQVLVVDFDAPLPHPYDEFEKQMFKPYALGLLLTHGDDVSIKRDILQPRLTEKKEQPLPQALSFYSKWLGEWYDFQIDSTRQSWHWNIKKT